MAKNKVDVCDGGPFSPARSQGGSSTGTSGQRKEGKSRRRQSSPVISLNGSGGLETRGQRSRTISAAIPGATSLPQQQQEQQPPPPPPPHQHVEKKQPKHHQPLPMCPRKTLKSEWDHEVDQVLRKVSPRGGDMADGYQMAPHLPPITPDSLAELDMPRIINNPKLRHDVNFDRELHFRPNLDGFKGKQKIESAKLYWEALEGEFVMCAYVQQKKHDADYAEKEEYWQAMLKASLLRLPKVFKAIRDILKTLVPDYDQQTITDRLDVALIMREISHGVCDLVDLANWLGKVLKSHCAPMRDELVDSMKKEIVRGATQQKPAKLVNGLRMLLAILEAMKLDVANHQIRHMRSILIDNAIEFSKHYNAHRVGQGKLDVVAAKIWIENSRSKIYRAAEEDIVPTHIDGMCTAIIKNLLFPDYAGPYPTTFYLDAERLKALGGEFQTMIYHLVVRDVLTEFCGRSAPAQELIKAHAALRVTVSAIVGPSGQFEENRENIAAEIMRIGLMLEGRPHITYDAVLLDRLEERLEIELQYGSAVYERHADIFRFRITPKLIASVEQHVKLSAVQIQDRLVPQMTVPVASYAMSFGAVCTPVMPTLSLDPDEDYIRRLTHILSLHWQTWADICYLLPLDELEASMPPNDGSSPPPSPTVPVAQAVYAAGHKWLPVGLTVTHVHTGLPSPASSPPPHTQSLETNESKGSEPEQGGKTSLNSKKQPQQSA